MTDVDKDDIDFELFDGFSVPNLGWDDDEAPQQGWKKEKKADKEVGNQGRETCWKCGTKTVKVDSGMFTVYDVCPKCKI